jgi:hypothetical protein
MIQRLLVLELLILGVSAGWVSDFLPTASAALVPGAQAALKPESIRTADARKTNAYLTDGVIVGGDRAIDEVVVKDIRRAANAGFERVVIDLDAHRDGEPAAIKRPPYYQVAVTSDEQRLVFTIWGRPKLTFDPQKVLSAMRKSGSIQGVELLPRLNDDSWTFVLGLKPRQSVEVFELSQPARIIVDIRSPAKATP